MVRSNYITSIFDLFTSSSRRILVAVLMLGRLLDVLKACSHIVTFN